MAYQSHTDVYDAAKGYTDQKATTYFQEFVGSGNTVTLTNVPFSITFVFAGGTIQRPGVDFTLTTNVIDFGTDMTGIQILVFYVGLTP